MFFPTESSEKEASWEDKEEKEPREGEETPEGITTGELGIAERYWIFCCKRESSSWSFWVFCKEVWYSCKVLVRLVISLLKALSSWSGNIKGVFCKRERDLWRFCGV